MEYVCPSCGIVTAESITDDIAESITGSMGLDQMERKSYYRHYEKTVKLCNALPDRGISTTIPITQYGYGVVKPIPYKLKRLKALDNETFIGRYSKVKYNKESVTKAMLELERMCRILALPDSVRERSAQIYRKFVALKLCKGRTIPMLCLLSLYHATKEAGINRSASEFRSVYHDGYNPQGLKKNIMSYYNHLQKQIGEEKMKEIFSTETISETERFDISDRIFSISGKLELDEPINRTALSIYRHIKENGYSHHFQGKQPIAVAASIVYLACLLRNVKMTQNQISLTSGVSTISIRKRVNELKPIIDRIGLLPACPPAHPPTHVLLP